MKLGFDPDELTTGAIVGQVDVVDCIQGSKSKWAFPGQWHWVLKNPRALKQAIPCKGMLGLFHPDLRLTKLSFA